MYKEVGFLRVGFMHAYYCLHFYYHLFVIPVLSVDQLENVLTYPSLSVTPYISTGHLYICQTAGVGIGKKCPQQAITDNLATHFGLSEIWKSLKIC